MSSTDIICALHLNDFTTDEMKRICNAALQRLKRKCAIVHEDGSSRVWRCDVSTLTALQ